MKKNLALIAVAICAAFAATPSFAQTYIGGSLGAAHQDVSCDGTINCNVNSTGVKVYGGYKFNPMFAAEIGYMNLGKIKASVDMGGGNVADMSVKTDGVMVGGALFVPFAPQWTGVARAGVYQVTAKTDVSGAVSGSLSETSTQPYFGLGVDYAVTPQWSVEGGLDLTKVKFGGETNNATLWSVGARFAF